MNSVKNVIIFTLSLLLSVSVAPAMISAAEGGWVEGEGYWEKSTDSKSIMSGSPESHEGYREAGEDHGTYVDMRVVGETEWKGKYHFTRARWEKYFTRTPVADSGRVWGYDSTIAKSGWIVDTFLRHASTYWGE